MSLSEKSRLAEPEEAVSSLTPSDLEDDEPVGEYLFPYVDSILYVLILIGLLAGWFAMTFLFEQIVVALGAPQIIVVVIFFGGLVSGYLLLRKGLARLYTFQGRAAVWRNRLRLELKGKRYDVSFGDIKRMSYRRKRTEKGFIFSAKKLSLYLEEASSTPFGIAGDASNLYEFYETLERETRIYKMAKDMRK